MSTNYILFENQEGSIELLEQSMKFDLEAYGKNYANVGISDLTLKQLKEINKELSKVISYFE